MYGSSIVLVSERFEMKLQSVEEKVLASINDVRVEVMKEVRYCLL